MTSQTSFVRRQLWRGHVLSWENNRSSFGRVKEVPFHIELTCYADTYAEARCRLTMAAEDLGYGLGGVLDIRPIPHPPISKRWKQKKEQRQSVSRQKEVSLDHMTREQMLAEMSRLEARLLSHIR